MNNRLLRAAYSQIKIELFVHFRERMFSIFHFSTAHFPSLVTGKLVAVFSHVLCLLMRAHRNLEVHKTPWFVNIFIKCWAQSKHNQWINWPGKGKQNIWASQNAHLNNFLIVHFKVNPRYNLLSDYNYFKRKAFNYLSSNELSALHKVFSVALMYEIIRKLSNSETNSSTHIPCIQSDSFYANLCKDSGIFR